MTNGGAKAVTTRKTLRPPGEGPTMSPPGQTIVSRVTRVPVTLPTVRHDLSPGGEHTAKKIIISLKYVLFLIFIGQVSSRNRL
jgi:hypothetical protein